MSCEYCRDENRKDIFIDDVFDIFEVAIDEDNSLRIDFTLEDYGACKNVKINYCLMCGRNLKTNNEMVERLR